MAHDTLKKKGSTIVVRQEHGTDIDAACGQLRSNTMKRDRQRGSHGSRYHKMTKKELILRLVGVFTAIVSVLLLPSLSFLQEWKLRYSNFGLAVFFFLTPHSSLWNLGEVTSWDISPLWIFCRIF